MSRANGWKLIEKHGSHIDSLIGVAPGGPGNTQAMSNRQRDWRHRGGEKLQPVVSDRNFVEVKLVARAQSRSRAETTASGLTRLRRATRANAPRPLDPHAAPQRSMLMHEMTQLRMTLDNGTTLMPRMCRWALMRAQPVVVHCRPRRRLAVAVRGAVLGESWSCG
jgi:hypothetical protein